MRERCIAQTLLAALLLALTQWVGCQSHNNSSPAGDAVAPSSAPAYLGYVDEIIGADGDVGPSFVDDDYRQLRRPDDITPIYQPEFLSPGEASVPSGELVIGLTINGDARAYPAGVLYNREMVNDTVGDVPVLVTWCPLCYTALVHERQLDDTFPVFGNQGALYKGAMTWYDHGTGSIWSQPTGEAIAGPLSGASLELIPSQLTTWGAWLAAHPHSLVLDTSAPAPPFTGRRPGEDHVMGVVVNGHAMAWPYRYVVNVGSIAVDIGGAHVQISVDQQTEAIRAAIRNHPGSGLSVIIAYRWAWERFYPNTVVDKAGFIH